MSFSIVQTNREPNMVLTVYVNGLAEDLSDATGLTMRAILPDETSVAVGTVTFNTTGVDGKLKVVWGASDNLLAGRIRAQITCTRGTGKTQTFPNKKEYFQWDVIPKI